MPHIHEAFRNGKGLHSEVVGVDMLGDLLKGDGGFEASAWAESLAPPFVGLESSYVWTLPGALGSQDDRVQHAVMGAHRARVRTI